MVSHPYGSGFNSLRGHAFVESNPRCSGSCVAHRLVRDRVRSPGDYFWLPLAQLSDIPCALVSRKSLFLLRHSRPIRKSTSQIGKGLGISSSIPPLTRGRCVIPSHLGHSAGKMRFLRYQMHLQWFCWKKMRLGVLDWAITLRLWNMKRLMFCVGFATAKISRFF